MRIASFRYACPVLLVTTGSLSWDKPPRMLHTDLLSQTAQSHLSLRLAPVLYAYGCQSDWKASSLSQPSQMLLRPITFATRETEIVTQTECQNLLLHLFQRQFMSVTHTDIRLHVGIFLGRNIYRAICVESQAACNFHCIPLVSLNFIFLVCGHC